MVVAERVTPWRLLVPSPRLPWFERVRIALQLVDMLEEWESLSLVHCDMYVFQVAFSDGFRPIIVDLDGLAPGPLFADKHCLSHDDCRGCWKGDHYHLNNLSLPTEAHCNMIEHTCPGYDTRYNMLTVGGELLHDLLVDNVPSSMWPDEQYGVQTSLLVRRSSRGDPSTRLRPADLRGDLEHMLTSRGLGFTFDTKVDEQLLVSIDELQDHKTSEIKLTTEAMVDAQNLERRLTAGEVGLVATGGVPPAEPPPPPRPHQGGAPAHAHHATIAQSGHRADPHPHHAGVAPLAHGKTKGAPAKGGKKDGAKKKGGRQ
jgi:hypothetical protein